MKKPILFNWYCSMANATFEYILYLALARL